MSKDLPNGDGNTDLPPLPMSDAVWQRIASDLAFSPQQKRIVNLLLRDQQNKEIATRLQLKLPTVRTHLTRIYVRTGTTSSQSLILYIFTLAQKLDG